MSFPKLYQKLWRQIRQSFIEPLLDKERNRLLIVGFIGVFFASLQSMVLNYGIAGEGVWVTTIYHILRLLFLGTVGIPLSFWLLTFSWGKWSIIAIQATGTGCFLFGINHPILNAIGFVMTTSAFWAVFSKTYALKQSRENHGRETVIFIYMQTIAGALGIFLGGYFLAADWYILSMILAGAGLILATFFSTPLLPKDSLPVIITNLLTRLFSHENPYKKAFSLINKRKPTTQLTFLSAMVNAMVDIGLPTWMSLVGMPPVSAGFALSLRPILGLLLTPVVGNLVQRSSIRVGQLGATFMLAGWIVLTFAVIYPFLLFPAMAIWAVANNLIGPTEVGWWLKKRSSAGIVAREILLAMGRLPAIGIMVPCLFLSASSFPFIGLAGSAIFLYDARRINRQIRFRNALGWRASNRSLLLR